MDTDDKYGYMLLPDGKRYSLDDKKTRINNNLCIVGCSGAGKTRGIITPNILECTGSYVITDPKGNLFNKWHPYLREHGYRVMRLSFIHPDIGSHYNPMRYLKTTMDIQQLSSIFASIGGMAINGDSFWGQTSLMLYNAVLGWLVETQSKDKRTIHNMMKLLRLSYRKGFDTDDRSTPLGVMMQELKDKNPHSWAVQQYDDLCLAAGKTWASIGITAVGKISTFDTDELQKMMRYDTINIPSIGKKKTAVFVEISDIDRQLDSLSNIFYTQVLSQLCRVADEECENYELPVPTRLIMDDFSTNARVEGFQNIISNIRSRKISATIVLQSLSQLETGYGKSAAETILENFDTLVYLGGNSPDTAQQISVRVNRPVEKIMHMPIGSCWIIRRGSEPAFVEHCMELDDYLRDKGIEVEGNHICK